jgi:hypothetical protein
MSDLCAVLHKIAWKKKRMGFPFDQSEIPLNGIYLLFEKGEKGHGGLPRIL